MEQLQSRDGTHVLLHTQLGKQEAKTDSNASLKVKQNQVNQGLMSHLEARDYRWC